jgi:nucleotide-binding universal stress UspA family protein
MLERFLVPLDTSDVAEQVLPYVVLLARRLGQPVVLLAVVPDGQEWNPLTSSYDATMASLREQRREYAEGYLARIVTRLQDQGVWATVDVGAGQVATAILASAESHRAGLIMMATHGRVGPERWFLGSVADRVVRSATVPIFLLRPRGEAAKEAPSIDRILLPLDGSSSAEAAIPYASLFAREFKVPVTVVQTVDLTALTGPETGRIAQNTLDSLEEGVRQYLQRVAADFREAGITSDIQFSFRPPAGEITDLAQEGSALIVMTTHGRSGLARTLLGSVTDKVVRSSVAPVLVVPPLISKEQEASSVAR